MSSPLGSLPGLWCESARGRPARATCRPGGRHKRTCQSQRRASCDTARRRRSRSFLGRTRGTGSARACRRKPRRRRRIQGHTKPTDEKKKTIVYKKYSSRNEYGFLRVDGGSLSFYFCFHGFTRACTRRKDTRRKTFLLPSPPFPQHPRPKTQNTELRTQHPKF